LSELKNKYSEVAILLGTIYDPSDWIGKFFRKDISRIYDLNKIIKSRADNKNVFIADVHRHFLGQRACILLYA